MKKISLFWLFAIVINEKTENLKIAHGKLKVHQQSVTTWQFWPTMVVPAYESLRDIVYMMLIMLKYCQIYP